MTFFEFGFLLIIYVLIRVYSFKYIEIEIAYSLDYLKILTHLCNQILRAKKCIIQLVFPFQV